MAVMMERIESDLNGMIRGRVHMGAKRKDIWMVDLGEAVGSEQGGIRPCIVYQNDIGNLHSPTTQVIPLTSKETKAKLPTHVVIKASSHGTRYDSVALVEQYKTVDQYRLLAKVGTIDDETMKKVDAAYLINGSLSYLIKYIQ